tara:strand:+ start:3737 stop:3955 length:219 start_codon:yes stop_codon:yes gene_type:complete
MCLSRPQAPAAPPRDLAAEQAQEDRQEQQTETQRTARQGALQDTITRKRGGTGRRSLISGSSGGMGYYNEYN